MAELNVADELQKLDELRQRGVISQQEFDAYKTKVLGSSQVAGEVERRSQPAPVISQDWPGTLTDAPPVLRVSGQPVRMTVEFRDAANVIVGPDDVPTWTEDSNGQVISLEVSADGLSATVTPRGIGNANVTVTTQANDGTTVQVTDEVAVVAGEPTHGVLHWTRPQPVAAHTPMASP